jgi:hypothetical protein
MLTTNRIAAIVIVFCLPLVQVPQGIATDSSWENLKHIYRHRDYTLVDRKFNCFQGEIAAISDNALTLKLLDGGSTASFDRSNVLFVDEGLTLALTLYSGRSSWLDVRALRRPWNIRIVTKSGGSLTGKFIQASDDSVTFQLRNQRNEIGKDHISRLYFLVGKPLSASADEAASEGIDGFFFPELWLYLFEGRPKISVRLYDSTMIEDNIPVACKP